MKHLLPVALLALSCTPSTTPQSDASTVHHDAPVTAIAPNAPRPVAPSNLVDASVRPDAQPVQGVPDWGDATGHGVLPPARVAALRTMLTSTPDEEAEHAAFLLARRAPLDTFGSILGVLPARLHRAFARGAAGRAPTDQPAQFPVTLAPALLAAHPPMELVTWAAKARIPVPGLTARTIRRLVASERLDDQIAGARLLGCPNADVPFELIDALPPLPMLLAFRAIAARGSTVPEHWARWTSLVASRLAANPRAWGTAWLALSDLAPLTDPAVRAAYLATAESVMAVTFEDPSVDAAFRCDVARRYDLLTGGTQRLATCAADAFRWRSHLAHVRSLGAHPTDPAAGGELLRVFREAQGDPRVLEAIAQTAVLFPPGIVRPVLGELSSSTDPGVLAALLEALTLHVQHARTIPNSRRDAMLWAPFTLDEPVSVEARQQAIVLSRALGTPLPQTPSVIRAMQQSANPDAAVVPQRSVQVPVPARTMRVQTHAGEVTILLDAPGAPEATALVVEAARAGRYDGTTFHRVVPGFVTQGGDPRGDGYGGTQRIVPTELSGAHFGRGAVGIALAGLDTGGMQFFVVTADAAHLDARYPWIGRVVAGMEVIDELQEGDVMERVVVEDTPRGEELSR